MSNPLSPTEDPDFHSSIQENLKQLSAQLGTPLDEASIMEIYQNACDLQKPRFPITPYPCPRCRNITGLPNRGDRTGRIKVVQHPSETMSGL